MRERPTGGWPVNTVALARDFGVSHHSVLHVLGEHLQVVWGALIAFVVVMLLTPAVGGMARLIGAVESGIKELAPAARVRVTSSPPVVGAALLGLDELGAGESDKQRLRREFAEVFSAIDNPPTGDGRT